MFAPFATLVFTPSLLVLVAVSQLLAHKTTLTLISDP